MNRMGRMKGQNARNPARICGRLIEPTPLGCKMIYIGVSHSTVSLNRITTRRADERNSQGGEPTLQVEWLRHLILLRLSV